MKKVSTQARLLWLGILILLAAPISVYSQKAVQKTVIAHRGASGYLPEHTLAAKAMAHAFGADLIEQDLVMTKDDKIVVLHDHHLDRVTNVQEIFPDRRRKDAIAARATGTSDFERKAAEAGDQTQGARHERMLPDSARPRSASVGTCG